MDHRPVLTRRVVTGITIAVAVAWIVFLAAVFIRR